MRSYLTLLRSSVLMLVRNRALMITSLGLALISILLFGWLFGSNGSAKLALGVADEDTSGAGARVVDGLRQNQSLAVSTGTQQEETRALRDGHRDAVIVLGPTFGQDLHAGHASIQVYYDQSNATTQASARMAVQNIVAQLNQQAIGQPSPVALEERAVSVHNLRQIDWLTPGMLGLVLLWGNLSVGILLANWRATGVLKRLAATPLRQTTLISSQMLARLLLSLGQCAILIGVASAAFKVQVVGSWWLLGLTVCVGALTLMAIGFIAGSFARSSEAANSIVLLVSFPMMFLGGAYFPTTGAPAFLKPVIQALPLSYLNDALRQVVNNGADFAAVQADLLVLLAWMAAALLLSTRAFRWSA